MSAQSLTESIVGHATRTPQAPALIWRQQQVTYGELAAQAKSYITTNTDAPIGIRAERSPQTLALILGCLLSHRAFLLASADQSQVALSNQLAAMPATATAGVTFMLSTSGSTGTPKIVPLTAGAIDRFTDWAIGQFGLRPGTVVLNYAPLNFDLCLLDVWATLKAGGVVVLVDPDHAVNPRYLADLITANEVEVIQAVPMLFALLRDSGTAEFTSVRHVISTGDVMPDRTLQTMPFMFGNARRYNLYGSTETNDSFLHEAAGQDTGPVPIGSPLPGVHTLIMDETGQPITGLGSGELWVCTPFQTTGYLGGNEVSARFVRHGEHIYFRTGDLVTRDAYQIVSLNGRLDFQVKVRGVRLNPQQIEAVIAAHPDVAEVAVVATADDLAGHRLHATVRRRSGVDLTSLGLREYCAAQLQRAAIPTTVRVGDKPLPRTSTGKIDRQLLIAQEAQ